jgi:hypothetical protein
MPSASNATARQASPNPSSVTRSQPSVSSSDLRQPPATPSFSRPTSPVPNISNSPAPRITRSEPAGRDSSLSLPARPATSPSASRPALAAPNVRAAQPPVSTPGSTDPTRPSAVSRQPGNVAGARSSSDASSRSADVFRRLGEMSRSRSSESPSRGSLMLAPIGAVPPEIRSPDRSPTTRESTLPSIRDRFQASTFGRQCSSGHQRASYDFHGAIGRARGIERAAANAADRPRRVDGAVATESPRARQTGQHTIRPNAHPTDHPAQWVHGRRRGSIPAIRSFPWGAVRRPAVCRITGDTFQRAIASWPGAASAIPRAIRTRASGFDHAEHRRPTIGSGSAVSLSWDRRRGPAARSAHPHLAPWRLASLPLPGSDLAIPL